MNGEMTALAGLIAGSVVAVALAAFKVIERTMAKKDTGQVAYGSLDRERLNTVAAVVTRCDAEGVPMAYVPRRLIRLAENQQDLMRTMTGLVEQQTALSRDLAESLKSHHGREEEELRKIHRVLGGMTE